MMRRALVVGCWLALAAVPAAGQTTPTVRVTGPVNNPITDGLATFTITTSGFAPADFPLSFELQVSTTSDFSGPLFADTTVAGPTATVTIPRLLPGDGFLYWRAFALTARAGSVPSEVSGPGVAPTHIRLVSPNNPSGQSLSSRRPTFVWQASQIPPAFGRWEFDLRIESNATGLSEFTTSTPDTVVTITRDLEANASYRWLVTARLSSTGESVIAQSAGSFVILSDEQPFATLLHHPFPSPFPSAFGTNACVWFDLGTSTQVSLDVIDLRGLLVRRLMPSSGGGATTMPAGRYGRPSPGATSGCDPQFVWDGTDARGRTVPAGIYVIRLRAGSRDFKERIVFQGR